MRRIYSLMRKLSRVDNRGPRWKSTDRQKTANRLELLPGVDAGIWANVKENYQLRQADKQS